MEAGDSEEVWILEGVEVAAEGAVRRGGKRPNQRARRSQSIADDGESEERSESKGSRSSKGVGSAGSFKGAVSPQRAARLDDRLADAAKAFKRDRYIEVVQILRPIIREAPGVSEVRELLGLSYYRLGRWKDALRELRAFHKLVGSTEQHPVLADCCRALGRYNEVEQYWDELRQASPSADLVAEGRIVMAGALADQDRLGDAIALLEDGRRRVKRARERHLRMAYALADLHERAGNVPAARSGFGWLQTQARGFADVEERLAALR